MWFGKSWDGTVDPELLTMATDPSSYGMWEALASIARCSGCHEEFRQGDLYGIDVVENWHEEITIVFLHVACADRAEDADVDAIRSLN
jgi:hypothetical protein